MREETGAISWARVAVFLTVLGVMTFVLSCAVMLP